MATLLDSTTTTGFDSPPGSEDNPIVIETVVCVGNLRTIPPYSSYPEVDGYSVRELHHAYTARTEYKITELKRNGFYRYTNAINSFFGTVETGESDKPPITPRGAGAFAGIAALLPLLVIIV